MSKVEELRPEIAAELGYGSAAKGVLVTDVAFGSVGYKEGIAAGMLVIRVNDVTVRSKARFQRAMRDSPTGRPALLLIASPDRRYLVVLGKDRGGWNRESNDTEPVTTSH